MGHWSVQARGDELILSIDALLKLSLEELMQVKVETVSKNVEDLYSAPGIISVISAEEIRRFGGNSLHDVLERATSIVMGGSILYPRNNTVMRGDQVNGLDRHILVLIDGRPVRDSLAGGVNFPIYNAFPLSMVERLEIIRGPGSVLYGTNAFTGVINIVTRDQPIREGEAGEITLSGGSRHAKHFDGYGSVSNDTLHVAVGAKYFQDDGWDFSAVDVNGRAGHVAMKLENMGTVLTGSYRDFRFNLAWVKSEGRLLGTSVNWAINGDVMAGRSELLADVGYTWKINPSQRLTVNATYNLTESYSSSDSQLVSQADVDDGSIELNHYLDFGRFSWLSGVNIERSRDRDIRYWTATQQLIEPTPQPSYDDVIYLAYTQLDYKPNSRTQVTVGGQVVKNPKQDLKFIPRLGLVHHLTPNWGGKLLLSEAYRAASQVERHINHPVVRGNPALLPETVQTLDAQIFYQHKKQQMSLTYFHSRQRDLIVRRAVPNSMAHEHFNQGELTIQGLELEARFSPSERWYLTGSLTYQQNENDVGQKDFTLAPRWLAKAGVSYQFASGTTFSLFDTYVSAAADPLIRNPFTKIVNPEVAAYHLATLNVSYPIGKILGWRSAQKLTLNAYVYNLLDEKIYAPEINSLGINSVPAKSGRSMYLGFQYQF